MKIRLRDLDPNFVHFVSRSSFSLIDAIGEADGLIFLCPKCFVKNHGPRGTHTVLTWFEGHVPADLDPGPGRTGVVSGSGYDDLHLAPSIQLLSPDGCRWHGIIENGEASIL